MKVSRKNAFAKIRPILQISVTIRDAVTAQISTDLKKSFVLVLTAAMVTSTSTPGSREMEVCPYQLPDLAILVSYM